MRATKDEKRLWARYWVNPTIANRNALVEHYMPTLQTNMVYWSQRMACMEDGDLLGFGGLRLIQAVETFALSKGSRFETHATNCIKRYYWQESTKEDRYRQRRKTAGLDGYEGVCQSRAFEAACHAEELPILDHLAKLPPRTQEIFRLRFYEGLTLEQAGERIGITRERVRQILNDGLKKIRELAG